MVKKIGAAVAVIAVAVLVFGVPAHAAVGKITGQLVDESCYSKDKSNTGLAHNGMSDTCAADCAKKGQTVALVTDKGEVYEVMGDLAGDKNVRLVPHLSHKVTLTGDIMESGGKKMIHATALAMVSK